MNRTVSRRLERLEARALASKDRSISFRIHLVHPEKGLTGIFVLESDKPTIEVPRPRRTKNGSAHRQNGSRNR